MNKTRKWLLTALFATGCGAAWAQALPTADTSPVQLEITDLYGDKQVVPLTDSMTLYWPQRLLETNSDEGAFAVLCDKDGTPIWSIPVNSKDLAHLKFLGSPAATTQAQMDAYKNPDVWDPTIRLIFNVGGKGYLIPKPGELHFSSPLGTYELVTATGESYTIPMTETELIQYQDTIQGIGGYLEKIKEGNEVYYGAFYDGQDGSYRNGTYEDFYALIPDATDHNISMFVPSDEAFSHAPDPTSINSRTPRALNFYFYISYIKGAAYRYDFQTGELGAPFTGSSGPLDNTTIGKYLVMMLRSHTILHKDKAGLDSGNDYYLALDGSPIRVVREGGKVVGVQSAFHLWNQRHGLTAASDTTGVPLMQADITSQRSKGNGNIFCINSTLEATPSSVYSILSGSELEEGAENPFAKFYELCEKSGAFVNNKGVYDYGLDFVRDIPFTLYVPTNEAVEQEMGSIVNEINALDQQMTETEDDSIRQELNSRIGEKKAIVRDFVKAHIQFGIEIADKLPCSGRHNTALVKNGSLCTPRLMVKGLGEGRMTVTDECGNTRNILDAHKNIFVREAHCSSSPMNVIMRGVTLETYAIGVIHQIDGVLRYNP